MPSFSIFVASAFFIFHVHVCGFGLVHILDKATWPMADDDNASINAVPEELQEVPVPAELGTCKHCKINLEDPDCSFMLRDNVEELLVEVLCRKCLLLAIPGRKDRRCCPCFEAGRQPWKDHRWMGACQHPDCRHWVCPNCLDGSGWTVCACHGNWTPPEGTPPNTPPSPGYLTSGAAELSDGFQ